MAKLWLENRAAKTALVALMIFAACPASISITQAQEKVDFRWHGRLKPGMSIQIKGVSGTIRAERSSSNEVEIVGVKQGAANLNDVRVKAIEDGGGVLICVGYPDWDANNPYGSLRG